MNPTNPPLPPEDDENDDEFDSDLDTIPEPTGPFTDPEPARPAEPVPAAGRLDAALAESRPAKLPAGAYRGAGGRHRYVGGGRGRRAAN